MDLEQLRYPIGKFSPISQASPSDREQAIEEIKRFPNALFAAVSPLSEQELDLPYRPGGWSIRQLVHHCADSHTQALFRVKLALTEPNPTIKPYLEGEWAQLPDANLPAHLSVDQLRIVHQKWACLLEAMSAEEFKKTFYHPEKQRSQSLEEVTFLYAWHGKHHLAHVPGAVARNVYR